MARALTVAAVLTACLVAAAASAGSDSAPPPDERLAARQFSYAALQLRIAVKALPPLESRLDRLFESRRCVRALRAAERIRSVREPFGEVLATAIAGAHFVPLGPAFGAFQFRLDRAATADPALRAGRSAWRAAIAALAELRVPKDLCGDLDRWRRTGFRRSAAPRYGRLDLEALAPLDRKFERARQRLRALGIGRGAAKRFAAEGLFDDLGGQG